MARWAGRGKGVWLGGLVEEDGSVERWAGRGEGAWMDMWVLGWVNVWMDR